MARSVIVRVYNNTGSIIPGGTAVYQTGYDEGRNLTLIAPASNNSENTMPAIGVTREDLEPGAEGVVKKAGLIGNINTSNVDPNTPVYVGVDGELIFEDPAEFVSNSEIFSQQLGTVTKSGLTDGLIDLFPLEVRPKIHHIELEDVLEDQHHPKVTVQNRGGGKAIFKQINNQELIFRTITAGTNSHLIINEFTDRIEINNDDLVSGAGTGANTQVAFWDSTTSITGDSAFTWDSGTGQLSLNNVLALAEGSAPSGSSGFGKLYVKSSDSRLYFKDEGGVEFDLLAAGTGVPEITFQENKSYWDEAIHHLRVAADGYSSGAGFVTGSGAVGQVAFWDGASSLDGENSLYWDSANDRLGIGTSSPSYFLHGSGANGTDSTLGLTNTSGARTWTTGVWTDGVWYISDATAGQDRFSINSSGNVKLGTGTSSAEKLEIDGAIVIGNASGSANGTIRYTGTDFEGRVGGSWESLTSGGGGTPAGADGAVQYNNSGSFGGDATNFYWDDTNDRLGIGTSSPSVELEVAGQARVISASYPPFHAGRSTASTNSHQAVARFEAQSTNASISDGFGAHIDFNIGDSGGTQTVGRLGFERDGADNSSKFYLDTDNAGTLTTHVVVDPSGNVGIGDTIPDVKLQVEESSNSVTAFSLNNFDSGSSAYAQLRIRGNSNHLRGEAFSTTYSGTLGGQSLAEAVSLRGSSSSKMLIGTDDAAPIYFYTNDSNAIVIDTSQQIGIGTTSPNRILEVRNDTSNEGRLRITSIATTGGAYSGLEFFGKDGIASTFGGGLFREQNTDDVTLWTSGGVVLTGQDSTGYVGIGTNVNEKLTVDGVISLIETTSPSDTSGYGKVFVKSSDSKLYFRDDGGTEYDLTAAGGSGLSEQTFQEFKTAQGEINDHVLVALDGYASDQTISEHYNQHSEALQTIIKDLDGYGLDYSSLTSEPTGFPNRTDSTISFSDANRRISVEPVGTSFDIYIKGVKYTISSTATHDIADTEGLHFIYFDGTTLSSTTTFDESLLKDYAYVSIVYWDATNNTHVYFADERHGLTMDWATHLHMHSSFGAQYTGGLAIGNITADGDGSLDAHAQLSVENGSIRDEDLSITITNGSPQILSLPAQIPVLYRSGANGDWRIKSADTFPIIYSGTAGYTGPNGRLPYNEFTGSTWQLTEVSNGDFVLVHILATNDAEHPIVAIQGQDTYTTLGNARENATSFAVEGLPFAEIVPIGTVIFQTRNADTNTIKGRIRSTDTGDDYVDLRGFAYTSTGSTGSHSNLSNLGFDVSNHSGFQRETFVASVAPDELDDGYGSGETGLNFSIGTFWINRYTEDLYVCNNNALNAARWEKVVTAPDLDGYTSSSEFVSEQTFQENKNAQNEINKHIIDSLDGYGTGTGTGNIDGSGQDGYLAVFSDEDTILGEPELYFNRDDGYLGIGTTEPHERLTIDGAISLKETSEPAAELGFGKLYVNVENGRIYLKRDNGENIDLTAFDIDGGNFLDTFENTRNFDAGTF